MFYEFSRQYEDEGSPFSLSLPVLGLNEEARQECMTNETIVKLIQCIKEYLNAPTGYT